MSKILKLAFEIKTAALEIEKEAVDNVKKMPVFLPTNVPKGDSPEMSNYKSFLLKLEQTKTEPQNASAIRYLNFLANLLTQDNLNRVQFARNTFVARIQQAITAQNEKEEDSEQPDEALWTSASLSQRIRQILNKYNKSLDTHPVVRFFKEILNYGVITGKTPFMKLFTQPKKFQTTFSVQTEKQKIKQEVKQKKLPGEI
jgi:hypothetical protein